MSVERRILATFDLKRTSAPADARPDELMIDWTNLPTGSSASLYLPGAKAGDILATAQSLYGYQPFRRLDDATVGCTAKGVSLMPVPRSSGNLAGLLEVRLPARARPGEKYTIAVNQVTNVEARVPVSNGAVAAPVLYLPPRVRPIAWRKAVGAFKLAILVRSEKETLPALERNLSLLRWIFKSIPADSRWRPIFVRHLGGLGQQVSARGGDPAKIPATGDGVWPGGPGSAPGLGDRGKAQPGHGEGPELGRHHDRNGIAGKIFGLVFDHFGDFEGFILETDSAERVHFYSRESNLREVVERAWADRLRVTVYRYDEDGRRPRRIVLYYTPDRLG